MGISGQSLFMRDCVRRLQTLMTMCPDINPHALTFAFFYANRVNCILVECGVVSSKWLAVVFFCPPSFTRTRMSPRAEQAVSQERLLLQKLQKEAEAFPRPLSGIEPLLSHKPFMPACLHFLFYFPNASEKNARQKLVSALNENVT